MLLSHSSAPQHFSARKPNTLYTASNQSQPSARPLLPEKPTADRIYFGHRGSKDIPVEPTLNLIPWGAPVQVPVESIRTLKPEGGNVSPEKSEVFEIVLDVTQTALKDQEGNPQLWPGHQLRIKCDIPEALQTTDPEYATYLEAMQHTETLPKEVKLRSPKDETYVRSRPYSVADVKKMPDGRVLATLVVRRVEYEQDGKTIQGLRSNQLANKKPGEVVKITGAARNDFILPPREANMLIFGTGISNVGPLKYMVQARLERQTGKLGETCHYAGYKSHKDTLASDLYQEYEQDSDKRFHYAEAFSREPKPGQPRQHIQDLIEKDADRILKLILDPKTYVYMCGVKDVATGVEETLLKVARKKSLYTYWRVESRITQMKKNYQWRVEGVRSPEVKETNLSGIQKFFRSVQRFFLNWWADLRARWKTACKE